MKVEVAKKLLIYCFALALSGCGGGASNDWASQDPSARAISATNFDIQTAWTNLNSAPNSAQLNVSGSCTGTYILSNTQSLLQAGSGSVMLNNTAINRSYLYCVAPYETMSSVDYRLIYNKYSSADGHLDNYYSYVSDYSERFYWRHPFAQFPAAAKVGDSGLIGVMDNYDYYASKINVHEWSYIIEEDTAYSAIFNLVVKIYDTTTSITNTDYLAAPVSRTEQFRYLLSPDNQLRLIKYDRVDANGFTIYGRLN